jgi:hypothetical protein
MRHDLRDEGGLYRCCTPAEQRAKRAVELTQTHEGRFTHKRDADERRRDIGVTTAWDTPRFVDRHVNREPHFALKSKEPF